MYVVVLFTVIFVNVAYRYDLKQGTNISFGHGVYSLQLFFHPLGFASLDTLGTVSVPVFVTTVHRYRVALSILNPVSWFGSLVGWEWAQYRYDTAMP